MQQRKSVVLKREQLAAKSKALLQQQNPQASPQTAVGPGSTHTSGTSTGGASEQPAGAGEQASARQGPLSTFVWGTDEEGQAADGTDFRGTIKSPQQIRMLRGSRAAAHISAGSAHVAAVCTGGEVLTWGTGSEGQLGGGRALLQASRPFIVPWFREVPASQVSCGGSHTLVLARDGRVFSFGCNEQGQLGLGHGAGAAHWSP